MSDGKCIQTVPGQWRMRRCVRKSGFGPNGDYCKQHAPPDEMRTWYVVRSYVNTIAAEQMAEVSATMLANSGGQRRKKKSSFESWFPTRDEAVDYLECRLVDDVIAAKKRATAAVEALDKFRDAKAKL